jgi:Mycolic acid cyclopropane synthetase
MSEFSGLSTKDRLWPLGAGGHKPSPKPTAGKGHFLRGGRHVRPNYRDVQYRYDLSDDFFQFFLDESLTHSCAYFLRNGERPLAKRTRQGRHSRL